MAFVPVYIFILGGTIVVDYFAGLYLEKATGKKKLWGLYASLAANLGVLAAFKYWNWLNENLHEILRAAGFSGSPLPFLEILLPIGLSFHTFQAMSYTLEVYKGRYPAERNFGLYALYVMFYPQLVAGPIERPQNVLPQFHEEKHFNYYNMTRGLKLMLWGLFKKAVIADRISTITDQVYASPENYSGAALILATAAFAIQIFCDFSGYSDMALGSAQTMGFTLMQNFDRPYRAQTMSEFWRRWHISLSTWFRDYVYIPLGGNRVSPTRQRANQMAVFLLSGLWHGANWTFVVWGGIHGFYLIFADLTRKIRYRAVQVLGLEKLGAGYVYIQRFTVFVLASVAWVFFRADTIQKAFYIVTHFAKGEVFPLLARAFSGADWKTVLQIRFPQEDIWIGLLSIAFLFFIHEVQERRRVTDLISAWPAWAKYPLYFVSLFTLYHLGKFTDASFIYFQF
jgi:D-alanyl-lipoteichoic acid acyltransferase DltB (MBOAT superfamily)